MQSTAIPAQFQIAWGASAPGGDIRQIPLTSQIGVQNGAASYPDGFPPLCGIPISAGGAYPFMQDFNGINNAITLAIQWMQAGGLAVYNAAFSAAIGGYPKGAILQNAAKNALWISTTENNVTDPDTGGAGWIAWISGTSFQKEVPLLLPYGLYPALSQQVGDTNVAEFIKLYPMSIQMPGVILGNSVDLTKPIKLLLSYTGDVVNNNYFIQLGYQVVSNGSLVASYTNVTDTLVAPANVGYRQVYTTTTAIIPAASLVANAEINCILTRLSTNAADTNTGDLQLIDIKMVQ